MNQREDRDSSDARGASAEAVPDRCDYCGGRIATDDWHPVATRRDDDGKIAIHDFCDEECRDAWVRERDE